MISDAFRYEGLIVGSPTYSMQIFPPVEQFLIAMSTREIKNKVFATFSSFTWASAASGKMKEYAEKMKLDIVDSLDMKQSATQSTFEDAARLAENVVAVLTKR